MTTTIETGALDKALRTLKLSGMLDTIEARLAQARAGELGHIEFLQVLCEDEISRRETSPSTRRLRQARFEEQATLEGFDFTAIPEAARRPDPRPGRPALAARRRVGDPLRPRRRRAKATSPRPSATWPSATAPTSGSSKPAAPWPTWPAATPTTPGTNASASSPGPPC